MKFNTECIGILKEIANGYTGEDVGLIKSIIFQICNLSDISIEEFGSSNINFNSTDENPEFYITENTENKYKDYRIKNLYLKNFRTFPYIEGSVPYGIKFTDEHNNPSSLFLLGSNGTGKTTLFSALEYYYSGAVSYALSRGIKDERIEQFRTFGFERTDSIKKEDIILGVEQMGDSNIKEHTLDDVLNIPSLAPFCSEYDFKIIQDKDDITEFVLAQMGYSDIYKLRKRIVEIIEERNDFSAHLTYLIENQKELLEPEDMRLLIDELIHHSLHRFRFDKLNDEAIDEKIDEIEEKQKELKNLAFYTIWNQIYNNKIAISKITDEDTKTAAQNAIDKNRNKIKVLYKRLYALLGERHKGNLDIKWLTKTANQLQEELELSKDLTFINLKKRKEYTDNQIKALNNLRASFDNKINEILEEFIRDFNSFIVGTLDIFSDNKESFSLVKTIGVNELSSILKILIDELGGYVADSHEYLNTFRFELFVIALKVALAIKYMQKQKLILPIVIDDVLNANDFENSIKLEKFICKIYQEYNKYIYKDSNSTPLQLIVFTHDEKVQNAFKKGFAKSKFLYYSKDNTEKNEQKQAHTYIMGRLFPYSMAEKIFRKKEEYNCTRCPKYFCHKCYSKSCEHRKIPEFYNLYLKLN